MTLRLIPIVIAAALATAAPAAAEPLAEGVPTLPPACFGADDAGGSCTALGPGVDLTLPDDLAVSPDGRFAYATAAGQRRIEIFARDTQTGALSSAGHVTTQQAPRGLAISPDGGHLYVSGGASLYVRGTVRAYARDAQTGALGVVGCVAEVVTGSGPAGCVERDGLADANEIHLSPDGKALYVTAQQAGGDGDGNGTGDGAVTVLRIDPVGGGFTAGRCLPAHSAPSGACAVPATPQLKGVGEITTTPDGRHAIARAGHDLIVLNRIAAGPDQGLLSGYAGCVSPYTDHGCTHVQALQYGPYALAMTPDSRQLVVGAGHGVGSGALFFDRNAESGALTLRRCFNEYGVQGCATDTAVRDRIVTDVVVSPDGRTIHLGGAGDAGVFNHGLLVTYRRDPATGDVSRVGCTLGDVSTEPGCLANGYGGNLGALALAPDGRLLATLMRTADGYAGYVASFARTPAPKQDPTPGSPTRADPAPAPSQPAPTTGEPGPPAAKQPLLLDLRLERPGVRRVVVRHELRAAATLELRAQRRRDGAWKPVGRALQLSVAAGRGRSVLGRPRLRRLGIAPHGRFRIAVRVLAESGNARLVRLPAATRG